MNKLADTRYPIIEALKKRWSPRAYDSTRPVEQEKLLSMFEAARWAPSSANQQPWRYMVATSDNQVEFERMLSCLNERNQRWAKNAGVLLIGVAHKLRSSGKPNRHAWYDVGQATAMLITQATDLGLHARQMAGFSSEAARETYDIPEEFEPVVAIAIGYLADASILPEDLQEREMATRSRRPLEETVFNGSWNKTANLIEED
jgi:nitroreductase